MILLIYFFIFMDFILLIPDLILKFKVILFSLLRNQFLFMVSTFIIAYFYLHTNLTTALEVSQPSFHKLIFGATGQSILSHCNSSTELICVSFLVCGSCFLFNYLTKSYVLKDADTITREHTEDRPIFGETPLLSSTAQRANLDREVQSYNASIASVKIPDVIIAEAAPIIGVSKPVLETRTFDVPTSYTTLWDQYILPTYKFLISFF